MQDQSKHLTNINKSIINRLSSRPEILDLLKEDLAREFDIKSEGSNNFEDVFNKVFLNEGANNVLDQTKN